MTAEEWADFAKEQATKWFEFWQREYPKTIAICGMLIGGFIMLHAAHHTNTQGCMVTLEDKLFDAGFSVVTFFLGMLGTLTVGDRLGKG